MKNLIRSLILLIFTGTLFVSCEKEDSVNEEINIETTLKNKSINPKSGITYIPQETFEEDLEDYMEVILENNLGIPIKFNMTLNETTSEYEITNEPSPNDPDNELYRTLCRGEKGAVANCMSNYMTFGIGFDDCTFDAAIYVVHDGPPKVWAGGVDCP